MSIKEVIRSHQPCGGGYGVALECTCGREYSARHQLAMLVEHGHIEP